MELQQLVERRLGILKRLNKINLLIEKEAMWKLIVMIKAVFTAHKNIHSFAMAEGNWFFRGKDDVQIRYNIVTEEGAPYLRGIAKHIMKYNLLENSLTMMKDGSIIVNGD